jgi:hypothetical protein
MAEWKLESGPKIPDSSFQIAIRTGLNPVKLEKKIDDPLFQPSPCNSATWLQGCNRRTPLILKAVQSEPKAAPKCATSAHTPSRAASAAAAAAEGRGSNP